MGYELQSLVPGKSTLFVYDDSLETSILRICHQLEKSRTFPIVAFQSLVFVDAVNYVSLGGDVLVDLVELSLDRGGLFIRGHPHVDGN